MIVLLRLCVIFSNILVVYCVSDGKFIRINGYKLTGPYSILNINSKIKCAEICLQTATCLSINYHSETKECQLNADSPNTNQGAVQEANGWAIYHLQRDNDWELVFRARANNSLSPYNAWMGTLSLPTPVENGCRLMTETSMCTTIYRSDVLNTWNLESISEVKLELYQGGNRVVNIRFNGTGTTYTNWFDNNRLIDSGWSTLSKNGTFNIFSLRGHCDRTFFINEWYNGCPNDVGWMVVIDHINNPCGCTYDVQSDTPAFLFSTGEDATRWDDHGYGRADVLAVFIKR